MDAKLTRTAVANAIAAAIGGRVWKSDVLPNGGQHIRVYPSGRGSFITIRSADGMSFRLVYDGGYNDGVATRCVNAGVVASSDRDAVLDSFLAPLRMVAEATAA